jgi:hypothetical protein
VVVSAGQVGCRWQRLNFGGGRRVSVGEGKMEEIDGNWNGWKKWENGRNGRDGMVFFFFF